MHSRKYNRFDFDLDFRLMLMKGAIGKIQEDNIEITPFVNEISKMTSI
ncbi:hypothetical protein [uncultured Methanobrevibacter sp.]|nr:hypothetical protein [uncultured Methanobrevibacter sp.]